jgi:hypothetical protein
VGSKALRDGPLNGSVNKKRLDCGKNYPTVALGIRRGLGLLYRSKDNLL